MTGNSNSALGGDFPKGNGPRAGDQITEANAGELEAGWIEWSGGENPVPGQSVEVRLRNAEEVELDVFEAFAIPIRSDGQAWAHGGGPFDIIAYRPAPSAVETPSAVGEQRITVPLAPGYVVTLRSDRASEKSKHGVSRGIPSNLEYALACEVRDLRAALSPSAAACECEALRTELTWYGEQARLARLIHSEGDAGRNALAADGGKRARQALHAGKTK